ncbi:glycosyltransferase family 2 protein [Spelaeicoccus albus]|uniref:Glycosyltransferase 2-like domain-containing protein n=1 Tax=Spelaeicoccus albus TaxID=1280376 RepID=A0A7Z0AAP7_9MICO|nr:glycosyltransferase family 2 protein [Spelaeicoccus albus]NYI66425.1 hypothetical protein [Spelaeicoccus albus]
MSLADLPQPSATHPDSQLGVSYIMPVLNEAKYIERSVTTVLAQDYPGEKEIILALGPCTDGTDRIVEVLNKANAAIRIVHNPGRDIPIGLNLAIEASRHPVIVRVDAHSELASDYTKQAVDTLMRTGAVNVGGLMDAQGETPFQQAVAYAYTSRVGIGGASYHVGAEEGPAESAYLGVFRRDALRRVGGFDETIRRGEDWELNLRLREAGGTVLFTPKLRVTYWPRTTWNKLVRQFHATGGWRGELFRRLGMRNSLRYFAPPALVVAIGSAVVALIVQLSTLGLLPTWVGIVLAVIELPTAIYILGVLMAGLLARGLSVKARGCLVAVLPTMHLSWGLGFIGGALRGAKHVVDTSRHH